MLDLWRRSTAPSRTDDLAGLRRLLDHDPGALIVADDGGEVVGSVVAGFDGWRGSVHRLTVAPSHRRTGLGTKLLRAAEEHLAERGARRLHALVVEDDARAVGFWAASGWHRQDDRVRFTRG